MTSTITIITNYSGYKTSFKTIKRKVFVTGKDFSFTCKYDGNYIHLEQDTFNGKPVTNHYHHNRTVLY